MRHRARGLAQRAAGRHGDHFTIGATFPLSGPAAYYAPIPVGMKAYFTYINTRKGADHKRGVGGRQIVWKYYDDGYNPANTVQQTRKLVEEDKVFALFGGLGTEPQQAVVDYLNQQKVPQLFVSTGATEFGAQSGESRTRSAGSRTTSPRAAIYGRYAAQNWPDEKIGVLYQNDDYGKNYLDGLKAGLGVEERRTSSRRRASASRTRASPQQVVAIRSVGRRRRSRSSRRRRPTIRTFATMKALECRPEQVILNSVSANDTS